MDITIAIEACALLSQNSEFLTAYWSDRCLFSDTLVNVRHVLEESLLSPPRMDTRFLAHPVRSVVILLTELSKLFMLI
jgi:hypothetical protein